MGVALTKTGIEAAMVKVSSGGRIELIDEREAGLRIRVGEKSARWSTMVRHPTDGRIRIPLGTWPSLGIADARKAAQDAKRKVEQGINPNEAKREAARKAEIAKRTRRALRDVLDDYSAVKLKHLRRGDAVKRALDGKMGLLRTMLDREPASITRTDIGDAVRKHAKTSPIAANRALAYASAFFNWCVSEELIEANPAGKVQKPGRENQRDRYHSLDELAEIWAAADTLGYPFAPLYKLLIVLPMRREEIAALPVAELDLGPDSDPSQGVWTLPSGRTKNAAALRVPLSPLARTIIKEALADPARPLDAVDASGRKVANPFLFSTTGETAVSGFTKGRRRLDKAIVEARAKAAKNTGTEPPEMAHWTLHDLRTSFTTLACRTLKVPANVADRCLNHVATATTSKISRIYNQDDLFDERRAALCAWASLIETTTGGQPSNVVLLRSAEAA